MSNDAPITAPPAPATGCVAALLIGLAAAVTCFALTTPNLDAPGAYYDEVNKAVPAFAWVGKVSPMFSLCRVAGIPLMVMRYKGAIRSQLYGPLWLATGHDFTITSWRLVSILIVSLGLVAFTMLARWRLPWWGLVLAAGVLLTDNTLMLGTRHDWGPIGIAFVVRLLMIGCWLRGSVRSPGSTAVAFAVGALAGFAVWDKLSSVVLVPLVFSWILLDGQGARLRRSLAAVAGGIVGGLPVIVVNLKWFLQYGTIFALGEVRGSQAHAARNLWRVVVGCLDLGNGGGFRQDMLGDTPHPWMAGVEAALMAAVILGAGIVAWRIWRARGDGAALGPPRFAGTAPARVAGLLLMSWVLTVLGLYALPETTREHHWVLATPFAAIAALCAVTVGRTGAVASHPGGRVVRAVTLAVFVALIGARLPGVLDVQQGLREGRTGPRWSPELTALGEFAARSPDTTGFVAAGWGVATQIYCFAQGRPDVVGEVYQDYAGRERFEKGLDEWSDKTTVYVVALDPPDPASAETTARIFRDARSLQNWRIESPDGALTSLHRVQCLKLVRKLV